MGKFTAYKVALASLPQGVHEFEYHLGKQFFLDMENPDIHNADITVKLSVNHKADLYQMDFAVTGTITLICDRCLDDLIMPVDTTYTLGVKYGEDYNDDSDELLILPFSDSYLNVSYMIHDTVALTIPIKHVHPQGKCNRQMSDLLKKHRAQHADDVELDVDEGNDDGEIQIDSRWAALKNFTPDDPSDN